MIQRLHDASGNAPAAPETAQFSTKMPNREEEPVLSIPEYGFLFSLRFRFPFSALERRQPAERENLQNPGFRGKVRRKPPTNPAEEPK
jgi:hypothetical protein